MPQEFEKAVTKSYPSAYKTCMVEREKGRQIGRKVVLISQLRKKSHHSAVEKGRADRLLDEVCCREACQDYPGSNLRYSH